MSAYVLNTSELLFQILLHSNDASVVKGMQVCQFWFAVGKPIVWRALRSGHDLRNLLEILVPYAYDGGRLVLNDPSERAWKRFLQYSTHVRYLCADMSDRQHTNAVLEFLIKTRPVMEVFPALETLRWILDIGPGEYTTFRPTFQFEQPHNLVHLELGICTAVESLFHVFTALEVLPLETVTLPSFRASYTVLASLSRWPALREINSNRDLDFGLSHCSMGHISSQFGVDAFPSLIALTISGCPYDLSILLDDENFPYHIHSLAVQHMPCTDDPVPTYQKIVAKCPAVTEFILHDSHVDSYSPFTSLRPFLSFKLTRLVVKSCNPLSYDATEIEELVRSLPFIEDLDLGTEASRLDALIGTFTFDHLLLFSTHCPRLTRLGIHLDVSKECNPSPPNFIPFSSLRELDLAGSFLFDNVHDVDRAAILLSKMLPSRCRCICQYRGYLDSETGETFRRTLSKLRGR
ncbi:hypothetical protein H0H92_005866 [Tricholoma furcatifolium]|nr:hypothetical protein H0H92_005866 [Tricholoma furcatifolium]